MEGVYKELAAVRPDDNIKLGTWHRDSFHVWHGVTTALGFIGTAALLAKFKPSQRVFSAGVLACTPLFFIIAGGLKVKDPGYKTRYYIAGGS